VQGVICKILPTLFLKVRKTTSFVAGGVLYTVKLVFQEPEIFSCDFIFETSDT